MSMTARCAVIFPYTLSQLQNPLTRTIVAVEPPVEVGSDEEMDAVYQLFCGYCKIAWDHTDTGSPFLRLDPKVIGAEWLKWVAPVLPEAV